MHYMTRVFVILAVVLVGLIASGQGQVRKAPAFTAKGSDGGTHSLKSLTNGKTLVLYFISSTCPVNEEAMAYFKQIGTAYTGKLNFVGVIDEEEPGYKEWKKKFGNKFSVLYDDELKIIRSYQAMASPWVVVVNPAGEIVRVDQGYSAASLGELNAFMAKTAGVPAAKIDLTDAPSDMSYG
jgi:peroxiredoxin